MNYSGNVLKILGLYKPLKIVQRILHPSVCDYIDTRGSALWILQEKLQIAKVCKKSGHAGCLVLDDCSMAFPSFANNTLLLVQ